MFKKIRHILIVKPSALGDIVHSLPFLAVLSQQFPKAKIDWVVGYGLHWFLEGHPLINKLWVIKKDQWKNIGQLPTTLKEINQLQKGLKARNYDVCIDLSGLLRSGLICWASRATFKLGFKESDEGSPFFYTHKIHGSMNIHAIDRYLEIAKFMGCSIEKIEYPFAPYDPDPLILQGLPDRFCVMSPSAGKPANRWQAHKFGQLASKLGLPTIVVASSAEADIARKMVDHSKGKAISMAGKTSLKELVALIAKARFFVCNDTGPMHIAAALNIPVFAIFGPANPVRTGPYGDIHTVIRQDLACSPCYAQKPCADFKCMNEISVEKVLGLIEQKMGPV
ncbi:MAG: glycosyltransferase family 9 protein [Pseudomonadota bacterium]